MTEPFTPEDVELVAGTLEARGAGFWPHDAELVLAALAEAGRLLPADAELRERLRFRHPVSGDVTYVLHEGMPDHREYVQERRRMWVGPWLTSDPTPTVSPVTEENPNGT